MMMLFAALYFVKSTEVLSRILLNIGNGHATFFSGHVVSIGGLERH
jgi:hypothetical protein